MSAIASVPGLIEAGTVYTIDELKSRLRLGTHALRQARRAGLPIKYLGRRGYVLGSDVIQFIQSAARDEK